MWYTSNPTLEAGSDTSVFTSEVERSALELCKSMREVVVGQEVDKAFYEDCAMLPQKIAY